MFPISASCAALLLLLPSWLAAQPCQENYNRQGFFLGCTLEPGDRALNSIWVSQVFNVYGSVYGMDITQGVSWFVIDKKGKYHGQSLVRHQDRDCLMHEPAGWIGQLYGVGKNQYLAWNDGAEDGFYLVQIASDGLSALSHADGPAGNAQRLGAKPVFPGTQVLQPETAAESGPTLLVPLANRRQCFTP